MSAAAPFLPVFLTRLGASNLQIGLLTAMPGITGLILALAVGRFLQGQRHVVPWFSWARFLVAIAYALTAVMTMVVPSRYAVIAVLAVWAAATLPTIVVNVSFSVVMGNVAGPKHRFNLMSRRWSILGLTTSLAVVAAGALLRQLDFPSNYQWAFIGLSAGGLMSLYFSSRIQLPDVPPPVSSTGQSWRSYARLVTSQPAFVSFVLKQFVFYSAIGLATPLFPLYYVRVVNASDAWIGLVNTALTASPVIGYALWSRASRTRGTQFVLVGATLGLMLYPALTAATQRIELITLIAAFSGIFQAGVDLAFFDELLRRCPTEYMATFVSLAQSLQYCAIVVSPLVGTLLANQIGLGGALLVSAGLRLIGAGLFAWKK